MGFLKSKQRSTNMEQKFVNDTFKPVATGLTAQGQGGLASYLGSLTGDNNAGFEQYKNSTGYQNIFDEAMRGVSSNAAARGLLASGSTARALTDRAGQLGQQNFSQYLQQLLQGSKLGLEGGLQAGNLVADVGSQNKRVGGLINTLGDIGKVASGVGGVVGMFANPASAIGTLAGKAASFSDRRLKTDIELIDREPDGLGVYTYRYIWDDEPRTGVMVDEVAELRPWALGPVIEGYGTVNYGAL